MKSLRKVLWVAVLFPVILLSLLLVNRGVGYLVDKDPNKTFLIPHIEVSVFEIARLTKDTTDLIVKALVDNPLPFGFGMDSATYTLTINGKPVLAGVHLEPVFIKDGDSSWIKLPISVFNQNFSSVTKTSEMEGSDSAVYALEMVVYTNYLLKKQFRVHIKKQGPLFYLPQLDVKHLTWTMLRLNEADILLHTVITNKNVFDIEIKNLIYHFAVFGKRWAEGEKPGTIVIPSKTTMEFDLPVRISTEETGPEALNVLKQEGDVDYKMAWRFRINSDNDLLKNSIIMLESKNTARQFMKRSPQMK